VPPVLAFLAREAALDARGAYGSLNMGAGFALMVAADDAAATVSAARSAGTDARLAGAVEAGPRRVIIEPLGVTFQSEALQLRA